jgi:glycosyltransferase involved in cell wall biosynthesis
VLTVHDLAILRSPEAFPRWHRLYGTAGLRKVLRAADAVIAVSQFTRDEVVSLVGLAPERIRVVPNAVDPVFTTEGDVAGGEYVLAVATLEPRKNLARTVEAARLAGTELRVVGARGWGGVEVDGWVGELPDPELAALYRGARCVVYASLYEGFGLLVDPLDWASIASGIAEAIARRDALVPAGRGLASEYSWSRSADAVEALWKELV